MRRTAHHQWMEGIGMLFGTLGRNWRHFFKVIALVAVVVASCSFAGLIMLKTDLTPLGRGVLMSGAVLAPFSVYFALFMTELKIWARFMPMIATLGLIVTICSFAGPLTQPDNAAKASAGQQAAEGYMTDVARVDGCVIVGPESTFAPALEATNGQCVVQYDAVYNEIVIAPLAGLKVTDISNLYSNDRRQHVVTFPNVPGSIVLIAVHNLQPTDRRVQLPDYLQWQQVSVAFAPATWMVLNSAPPN